MLDLTRTRRRLLVAVLFLVLGFLVRCLSVNAQDTKPVSGTESEPAALLKGANEQFRKGDFDKAIAQYNQVLKSGMLTAEAYAGIVRCYLKQEDPDTASETLEKALQAKPADPGLKVAQAEVLFRQGKIPDAEKILVPVINTGGAPARAYLALARISAASGLYAREHRLILKAHDLDSTDPDIERAWMRTLPRQDHIKVVESNVAEARDDHSDVVSGPREHLEAQKAREGLQGNCHLISDVAATETDLLPLTRDTQRTGGIGLRSHEV